MLILLDIDGVMVPANSWKKPEFLGDGFPVFSPRSVKALQRVLSKTNASILLTTSHKEKYSLSAWRELLKLREINIAKMDRLATSSLTTSRKDEILEWFTKEHIPGEEFVIIDDDKMLNGLPENIRKNLVLTSPSVGLTDDLADEAIAILQKKEYSHI
jgi:hypothetical protein